MFRIKSGKRRMYHFHFYSNLAFKWRYRCKSGNANAISAWRVIWNYTYNTCKEGQKTIIAPFVNVPNINYNYIDLKMKKK